MAANENRARRLYGTTTPPAPHRVLRAGPLSAWLEDGNLRYVRFAGEEVLRAVSYVIRDRDWGTLRPVLSGLSVEDSDRGFNVAYDAVCHGENGTLAYRAVIEGDAAGRLSFVVEAKPEADFETNRCGFAVLHPLDVAGAPVAVEHTDGTVEKTVFPELIDPWQPFKTIRALTHRPGDRFEATCRMEGDTFEMEDQRNWSDASFKTYVRPLERPWPYTLPAGETNRQSVTVTIADAPQHNRRDETSAPSSATVRIGDATDASAPAIGVVVTPDEVDQALAHSERLGALGPQMILCHFDPTAGHGEKAIAAFARLQEACPAAAFCLECVVEGTGDPTQELAAVAGFVDAAGLTLSSIVVCPSADRKSTPPGSDWPNSLSFEALYGAARAAFPDTRLGGGMVSYFTELNRKRPPFDRIDFVTHATNPIVHAADDDSVMETLATLPHITRSVRAMAGDMAYRIGPSTIGMRQNPYGSRTIDNPDRDRICMAADDPRQNGLFAAAWTVGYAAAVAPADIEVLTCAGFTGPRGVVADTDDEPRPVFHALRWLAEHAGAGVCAVTVDDPMIAVLALRKNEGIAVFLANLGSEPRTIEIHGLVGPAKTTIIDANGGKPHEVKTDGGTISLALDAFAIARVKT